MSIPIKKRALVEYSHSTIETFVRPPALKVRLIRKSPPPKPLISLVQLLENTKTSNEALQVLLRICESPIDCNDKFEVEETLKKLSSFFKNEKEQSVRVKIFTVLFDLVDESNFDKMTIIDEIIYLLRNESSHKVIDQGLMILDRLGQLAMTTAGCCPLRSKLLEAANSFLSDSHQIVKCRCLEILANFLVVDYQNDETISTIKMIGDYFQCEDARVRGAAFNAFLQLKNRKLPLKYDIYDDVCKGLNDDYEIVRKTAIKLLCLLGIKYGDKMIKKTHAKKIRLIDDAFGKICNCITDVSVDIRVLAATLLGQMKSVSRHFLQQTLDKKLMSNMRKKASAHERAKMNLESGEWATGKKWADDAPKEELKASTIKLMSSGACGAFVHGLEDEFWEVRSATIESMCQLSIDNRAFAVTSLDFLVDMFNDEIEGVRLKAIDSLSKISQHIVIREDQLDIVLGALEDFSLEIRESLYKMLGSCTLETTNCLRMTIESVIDNLKKYPHDKKATYCCMQNIGRYHANVALSLVPELLKTHPIFDTLEPDVEDPLYVCVLILIFNAAKSYSPIINLFAEHTVRHYDYLRDTLPNFVPELKLNEKRENKTFAENYCESMKSLSLKKTMTMMTTTTTTTTKMQMTGELNIDENESRNFLETIIKNINTVGTSLLANRSLFEEAKEYLNRLVEMDENLSGIAQFNVLFIECQLMMSQIIDQNMWRNTCNQSAVQQQFNTFKICLRQILQTCLQLEYCFINCNTNQINAVKQLSLRAFTIFFIYIVKVTNLSALNLCQNYLGLIEELSITFENVKGMQNQILQDYYTKQIMDLVANMMEPKPGLLARSLLPIVEEIVLVQPPEPNLNTQMTTVIIHEPSNENDEALKFTSGLVIGITLDAEIRNLSDINRVRLKIKYPDQQLQIIVPKQSDFKNLSVANGCNYRLLTKISVSNSVWTEACHIEINIVLTVPEADLCTCKLLWNPIGGCLIDLCKPVKVLIVPKPVRKAI